MQAPLAGVMETLYSVAHPRVLREQPVRPVQLCRWPSEPSAVAVYSVPAALPFQETETTLVPQSTGVSKRSGGQGA